MRFVTTALLLGLGALGAREAAAQSQIYGMDVRLARFFSSSTVNFVSNFIMIGPNAAPTFALDFDETATTLWGINNTSREYGTFDLSTGAFNPLGFISGPPATDNVSGLTCTVGGVWYISVLDAAAANGSLWVGNVTTGTFTLVGPMGATFMIDISIDSQNRMYGNSISTDSLYSIDITTGAATLIGPTGQATNFAQGMDFDWTTDTLYATLYTGGGTGVFASLDLNTGAATVLDVTTPLNSEMEMAVKQPAASCPPASTYCTAKTSSSGCVPAMGFTGTPTPAGSFTATGSNIEVAQLGVLFYGTTGPAATPFQGGFLCVNPPVVRFPVQPSGGSAACTGSYSQSLASLISPAGTTYHVQWWFRDPGAASGTGLSNGGTFTTCP